MSDDPVWYPAMRAEVVEALTSLADPVLQRRYWIERNFPTPNYYQDLTAVINRLYDDTMVLPEPAKALESVLRNEAEVHALDRLNEVLDPLITELGESSDERYMSDPAWQEIVQRAAHALALMTEQAHAVAQRVRGVEWTATEYRHTRSRVLLVREFLRRSALWVGALDLGDHWPFLDVARTLRGHDTAPTALMDDVRGDLESKRVGGYASAMALAAVNLAALRDCDAELPDLADLYEPLLVMFERGGGFSVDRTGMVDVDSAGVPIKDLLHNAALPALTQLDKSTLDAIDIELEERRQW